MKPSVRCCLSGGRGPSVRMESVPSLQKSPLLVTLRPPSVLLLFSFFSSLLLSDFVRVSGGFGSDRRQVDGVFVFVIYSFLLNFPFRSL